MRVFTDGSCTSNGRKGAKAGYAAWFPDHPAWSSAHRVPDDQDQTNNRAELSAILLAVAITHLFVGRMRAAGLKTAAGKDVLHHDLIKDTTARLSKFKSHRFVHVKAHTGGLDELSKHNAVVDKMAQDIVNGIVPKPEIPVVVDELFPGCPLRIMGGPTQQKDIVTWMRTSIDTLDKELIDKHLYKAFAEMCKARDVALVRQVISKTPVIRAERGHLQIDAVDKVENDS